MSFLYRTFIRLRSSSVNFKKEPVNMSVFKDLVEAYKLRPGELFLHVSANTYLV
jgi:hypothetical protein